MRITNSITRTLVALTAIAFVAFARDAAAQATYNNSYLGGGVWEQDANWSITVYAHNGRTRPDANGNPIPGPNPQYNAIINTAPCVLSIGVNVVSLNVGSAGSLGLASNGSLNAGSGGILNNGAIALANFTRMRGVATLNGITSLNSTGNGSHLEFGNGSVINGQLLMSNNGTNYTSAVNHGDTVTVAQSGIVRGAGQLNVGFFGDTEHMANWVNHGLIEGNQPNALLISLANSVSSHLTNDGTIRATGGGTVQVRHLSDRGSVFNTGGVIEAQDGSAFQLANDVTLEGGTLTTSGSGKIGGTPASGGCGTYKDLVNNGTMAVGNSESLRLAGTITNNGLVRMDSTPGTAANLFFNNNTVLAGSGTLTMSNSGTNYVMSTAQGDNVTLAAGATIQGAGTINPGFSGTGMMNFTNNGLVNANQPAGINFRLGAHVGANLTNNGTMRASNGSTLRFYNGSANDLITNTNGTIEALDGGTVRLANFVTIDGGTLATAGTGAIRGDTSGGGSGTFSNVTNTGTMAIANSEQLRIGGNFVNNGVLRMDSTQGTGANLYFLNGTVISGTGTIALSPSSTNYIYGVSSGDTLAIGPGITLRGTAQISPGFSGTGILSITNHGLIESTNYIRIALNNASNSNMVNTGTMRATAGATIEMHAFSAGSQLTNQGGTIDLPAGATLNGSASFQLLQTSGTIDLDGTMALPFGLDLNGGQLVGGGTFTGQVRNNGGVVAPGNSPGKLTINGSYTQGANGVLNIELGGTAPGTEYDQLVVNGPVTLGGTLNLVAINGFKPAVGDQFTIIAANNFSGSFGTINTTGFTASVEYTSSGARITVTDVAPEITSSTNASGTQGQPFSYQITATGNPTSYGASGLPAGLSIDPSTGLISGTPTASGSFGATISAANSAGADSEQLSITIAAAATPTPTPSASPTPTATASPSPAASPSPSPTASPSTTLLNISTRLRVGTGENALIGGFIITGTEAKKVIVRAIGPSLTQQDVAGALQDPTLQLFDGAGEPITSNDNWKDDQQSEIEATTIPPGDDLESAIVRTLDPGNYTAVVRGKNNSTGIGLVEIYDVSSAADAKLANISSRGFVETGENVLIGGFIVSGGGAETRVVLRAIGPSLSNSGVEGALQDPALQLVDANGTVVRENDDWKDGQRAELEALQIAPANDLEAALIADVSGGNYTAIVRGNNDATGVGLVEVYNIQ